MVFQNIIVFLQKFWMEQDCLLWYPYDMEKGAGTMNPATFLRALGPEPWAVAYLEPSRRPQDGRYGRIPTGFSAFAIPGDHQTCSGRYTGST